MFTRFAICKGPIRHESEERDEVPFMKRKKRKDKVYSLDFLSPKKTKKNDDTKTKIRNNKLKQNEVKIKIDNTNKVKNNHSKTKIKSNHSKTKIKSNHSKKHRNKSFDNDISISKVF